MKTCFVLTVLTPTTSNAARVLATIASILFGFYSSATAQTEVGENEAWELVLSDEIKDSQTCEDVMAEFSRYCSYFAHVDKRLHPDFSDWQRGGLQYAWFDFDEDGRLDLFVRVRNFDWCGSLGCSNFIIFGNYTGNDNDSNIHVTVMANSNDRVFLWRMADMRLAMSFGDSSHQFSIDDEKLSNSMTLR